MHVTCFVEKARFEPRTLSTKAERYDHCGTRPVVFSSKKLLQSATLARMLLRFRVGVKGPIMVQHTATNLAGDLCRSCQAQHGVSLLHYSEASFLDSSPIVPILSVNA
jgi:hypothetical protein